MEKADLEKLVCFSISRVFPDDFTNVKSLKPFAYLDHDIFFYTIKTDWFHKNDSNEISHYRFCCGNYAGPNIRQCFVHTLDAKYMTYINSNVI